jgi:hypothetical protein
MLEALSLGWDALDAIPPGWQHRCQLVPYQAVGTWDGALLVLVPDGLAIWRRDRWVEVSGVIGLAMQPLGPEGQYQALLSPQMLREAERV